MEWGTIQDQNEKQLWAVCSQEKELLAFAGLSGYWGRKERFERCAIVVNHRVLALGSLHDAMPVISGLEGMRLWLASEVTNLSQLRLLLAPHVPAGLETHLDKPLSNMLKG